jgi:hypothetical protein
MPNRSSSNRREFLKASSLTSLFSLAAASGVLLRPHVSAAQTSGTWGDLTGRFLFAGEPPVRKPLTIPPDDPYASQFKLLEERLIVDPQTKGIANVLAWLYVSPRDPAPPIHDSYAETAESEVVIGSTKVSIDPHVNLMRTGQTLVLRNTDPIGDGFKIDFLMNPPLNILVQPEGEYRTRVQNEERMPARVSCPIHPWESGWLLVRSHPYMAVSGSDGRFVISNLPAGKWTFQFWQEAANYLEEATVDGAATQWRRGRADIEIRPGMNDLGDIVLAADKFAP